MPLYEYVCASCADRFERLVRSWNEAVTCPSCQGSEVERQISTFAFASAGDGPSRTAGCGCGGGGCGCARSH